ncbi:hypothetical protein DSM03_105129 [Leeuwenhoekiella aestuarii]|uniref:UbiA prenyltransferase family protein n=1 Tax=Leeuwenhoekiella aestuarii TaxID=2249426 RepID=A0A4Q0NQH7_9FLAO|nr:hypothetical protein [Leeuwenhoekiella aestuarii]RXG12648.1 hypothetical protein DSM04_106129 [Leeuwenhoekiella aestuarii]RXG14595.1 hypothetical protein DSM03_105129 [Leeuwenhoekiella aestuarii]
MKGLKSIFDFYINSSIHVALSVVCLSFISQKELNLLHEQTFDWFIFFGTITGYNFVKYAALAGLHHRNLTERLKSIQIFSVFCFIAMIYFGIQFEFQFWIFCLPLSLLTLLYALPFLPHKKNLRMVPSLKIFIIAAVWAGVSVYLPVVYDFTDWSTDATVLTAQRFLLVLALIIPFEIRDFNYDASSLGTLPQKLGIKKTKLFGLLMVTGCVILEFFRESWFSSASILHFIMLALTAFAILKAKTDQPTYYSSFYVEGIPILWFLLSLFFS